MKIFRRSFVKCFYCKKKVEKTKSYSIEYNAADGSGSVNLCNDCTEDLIKLTTDMKEIYDGN